MTIVHADDWLTMHVGDCRAVLAELEAESIQTVITSPPYYGLRDYGQEGQLGLEGDPFEYIANLVAVFREVRRVLRPDGTVWLNLGDSYATSATARNAGGSFQAERSVYRRSERPPRARLARHGFKNKDRMMIPARVALALHDDGWWIRDEIIWHKSNPMPSSVEDRTTPAHEMVYLLTKRARYWTDLEAIREGDTGRASGNVTRRVGDGTRSRLKTHLGSSVPYEPDGTGRNRRSVWTVATQPYPEAHFATFPEALVAPMVLAGAPEGATVLDPFGGSGTTALVANRLGRRAIYVDLSPEYAAQALERIGEARATGRGPAVDVPVPFADDGLWGWAATPAAAPGRDWTELADGRGPCETCRCVEGAHRPTGRPGRRGDCLYDAGHPATPCKRYAPPALVEAAS